MIKNDSLLFQKSLITKPFFKSSLFKFKQVVKRKYVTTNQIVDSINVTRDFDDLKITETMNELEHLSNDELCEMMFTKYCIINNIVFSSMKELFNDYKSYSSIMEINEENSPYLKDIYTVPSNSIKEIKESYDATFILIVDFKKDSLNKTDFFVLTILKSENIT